MYIDGEPVARIRKVCEMSEGTLYYWLDGGPADGDLHLEPLPRRRTGRTRSNEKTRHAPATVERRPGRAGRTALAHG